MAAELSLRAEGAAISEKQKLKIKEQK